MKKILITFLMLFSSLSFAIEPQVGVNFDKTVQVVPTDNKDKIEYKLNRSISKFCNRFPKKAFQ